jgi:hypothetical protein
MKEAQFLGTLLPSHPDFIPIVQAIRAKYKLPEISPDDDPITEIYLDEKIVPLEEFRQDIEYLIRENLTFLSPDTAKLYTSSKTLREMHNNPHRPSATSPKSCGFRGEIREAGEEIATT